MHGGRKTVLFREVNDRIAELLERAWPIAPGDFLCECGEGDCARRVTIALPDYRALRGRGLCIVAHDHTHAMSRACGEPLGASGRLAASI